MSDKPRVFLSYAQSDAAKARVLAQSLRSFGADIWMDTEIKFGEDWKDRVREELEKARFLIVLLSSENLKSRSMYAELGAAIADKKSVIAVVSEDIDPANVPPLLRKYQSIQDSAPDTVGKRIAELLKQIAETSAEESATAS